MNKSAYVTSLVRPVESWPAKAVGGRGHTNGNYLVVTLSISKAKRIYSKLRQINTNCVFVCFRSGRDFCLPLYCCVRDTKAGKYVALISYNAFANLADEAVTCFQWRWMIGMWLYARWIRYITDMDERRKLRRLQVFITFIGWNCVCDVSFIFMAQPMVRRWQRVIENPSNGRDGLCRETRMA